MVEVVTWAENFARQIQQSHYARVRRSFQPTLNLISQMATKTMLTNGRSHRTICDKFVNFISRFVTHVDAPLLV
jgi:hypothetical protein